MASIHGKKENKFFYLSIIQLLKEQKHDVFYQHILGESTESLSHSFDKNINFHQNILNELRETDFVVAEITHESISVGYLIHEALKFKKPVLALSRGKNAPNLSVFLENSENFTFYSYLKVFELEKNLAKLIKQIGIEKKKKFNFILSEKLDNKLEQLAQNRKISKGEYVRELLSNQPL